MKTELFIKKIFIIPALFFIFSGIYSCRKEGTGGKSSVTGNVKHHSMIIPNAVVYIKYGATNFPGTNISNYDASTTADASAHYEFKDLRKGDYYLYAVGYDAVGGYIVTGGTGVKLKYNKETAIDVPVTE
jgi:hypothetical protein